MNTLKAIQKSIQGGWIGLIVLWVTEEDVVYYNKNEHAPEVGKFVYWNFVKDDGYGYGSSSGLILIGPQYSQEELYLDARIHRVLPKDPGKPVAAGSSIQSPGGNIRFKTHEISWESSYYKIGTPENMVPLLKNILGAEMIGAQTSWPEDTEEDVVFPLDDNVALPMNFRAEAEPEKESWDSRISRKKELLKQRPPIMIQSLTSKWHRNRQEM